MDPFADIDLDSESVWLDGAWYTRDDLARRSKEMIEAGDFRVSRPSQALERLEAALGQAQVVAVRMPADLAQAASATAARLGRPVGHLVREAVAYYLAAAAAYGAAQRQADAQGASAAGSVEVDLEAEAPAGTTYFKKAR
jgi:predicted DNA-binding protein